MKKVCTRLLCCIMAFLVLVTLVPIGAYAAQDEQAHDPAGSRSGPATVGASPDDPDSGDPVDSDARFVVELSSKLRSGGSSVMRLKGGGQYDNGSEVTVIAYSKRGFTFVGWFNESDPEYTDCLSNKQSYTFTVTDDLSLIALYDRSAEAVYDVSITGSRFKINEGTTQANSAKFSFNAGEMVYVSFTDESMKFLYWENASRNIVSTSKDFSFLLVSNVKLNAIYTPLETADDSTLVVFRNAYNQILWTHSYSNSYHENIYFPQAPSKMGYTFREWQIADKDGNPTGVKATDSSIRSAMIGNDEVVVVPVYNAVGDNTYNYTVRFIEGSEDLVEPIHGIGTFGDAVNFTAPEIDGKEFLYWRLNDTIVGFDRVYTLLQAVNKDTVLEAVYGESGIDQQSFAGITQVFCSRADDKYVLSHTMQYYIPDDWTMAQAGFLYSYDSSVGSSEDSMVIDNTSVKRHIIGASDNRLIYTFNLKTSYPDRVFYVRGFIKYKDSTGALHTEYTPIKANSYNDINSIRYTVTWLNADGTLLKSDVSVPFGTIPEYDGETPSLAPDDSTLFVFAGWTPEITAVSKDVEYTAVYQETKRTYSGPVWSWNGLSSATASFTADDNSFYVKTVTAQISDTVTEQASCTADGSRTVTATVSFDGRTFTDTKSEAISALGHAFGEWKVTTDPTCTEKGEEIRTCSRCGAKETREVDKLGHEYIAIVTAPTCTEKGYTTHICSHCTDSYVDTYVDALGHDFGEWTVSKASSCTENGIEIRSCSRCDVTETRNVDAIGHDLVHHEAKAATCTEIGWNAYDTCSRCDYTTYVEIPATGHTPAEAVEENKVEATCTTAGSYDSVVYCSVCGAELSRETITIDALGHDFGEWTVSKASSCTENGIEIRYCSRCDVTETRNVDAIGHDLVHHEAKAATCTEIGWKAYDTCSRCDYTTYVEIPALGHEYTAVVTAPTCTEQGYTTHTCSHCNDSYVDAYVDALGHDFGEWTVTTTPTCTEKGEETRYCSRCDAYETRDVNALGHDLVHHEAKSATCTEIGWKAYDTCSRCDYTTYVEIPALGHTPGEAVEENRVEATCTTAGSYDSVVYCSVCGAELSRETITINALGHRWNTTPIWSWTGTTAATAVFTCEHDSSHTQSVTATVTSAAGTGANLGYTVYTATVSFNDQNYTDTNRTLITYNITYDLDGGSVSSANPASYNVTTATFTLNNPTREGFVFAGWTGTGLSSASDSVTVSEGSTGDRSYTATWTPMVLNTFFHSDNLSRTDTYLYRVGNGNTVSLGTLFKVDGDGTPSASNVKIKVEAVDNNSSVKGTGTNLESGSTAKCVYIKDSTDWTASTLKFTGEGPVKVTISEGTGETYSLNLEIVTGTNKVNDERLTADSSYVLLGNVKLKSGTNNGNSAALTLSNKHIYGNGFTIDVSDIDDSFTKNHGIIHLKNSSIDNAVIIGPTYSSYVTKAYDPHYAATVCCYEGNNVITNSRITGATAAVKTMSDAYIANTVLADGVFCNMQIDAGRVVLEDVTTVGTGVNLGIVFGTDCGVGSTLTINGALTQHNFIADNANMTGYAGTLKNKMFSNDYSNYQFTSGSRKYVNTGIISMTNNVGAANIVDNRTDKKNYSGMNARITILVASVDGYVYTMENTDYSMLETSYIEPDYTPSTQVPYEPVFNWSVPSSDNVAAGGDAHCYKDSAGVLQIQFPRGSSKTINASNYATFKKYGSTTAITPTSITCTNDTTGVLVAMNGTSVTFDDSGTYTLTYTYSGVPVYDKDLGTTTTVNYTKTIKVNVAAKKSTPNAEISVSGNTGTMVFASNGWDKDFQPYADVLSILTIYDYKADGTRYNVLTAGESQADFLGKISSIVKDSDNATGFTINLVNGTKLYVNHQHTPQDGSTLVFGKNNNHFYMGSDKAWAKSSNTGKSFTWYAYRYEYTGENGVTITVSGTYSFIGTTSTSDYKSMSSVSTTKSVVYVLNGGEMPDGVESYTTSTTVSSLPLPTKEGYTFLNWNTSADGSGTAYNAGTRYTWSNSTSLYAQWASNVTVTFNSNNSVIDTISAGAGTSQPLPTATQTTQWLEGWYTAENGGTRIGSAGASFTVPSSDTTYYAHWNPKYAVTYNANGGTVSTDSAVYEGTALTLPTPTNGAKTFEGWFTAAEGGTKIGSSGDSYVPTANIELFAQWSDNILVTFDGNGGTADTNSDTYDRINPIILPSATWSGHQFNGWFTAASGGTKVGDAGASYAPTEPITLHAQWTAYTVSFDGNGATNPSALSAGSNGSVTLPTPTRTGYTFNGWYTAATGGTKVGDAGASYTPTADITLHAQWTINSYKVNITTSNSSTAVTVNGTTVNNGGSVAYNSVVKVVLSYTQSNSLTFTIKQGSTNVTRYSNEACTTSTTSAAAGTYYFKMPAGDVTINSSSSASSGGNCVPSGTMVTMADGSKKAVEDVTADDRVLVFNHETGEFEEQGIIFYEADAIDDYRVVNLSFSDGSITRLIYEHGYFDLDLMKYVYIHENDYTDYIGHRFAKVVQNDDGYGIESVILTDAWVTEENTGCFSFPSVYSLNFVADDFLSMPGGVTGMFNFFDYDENLKYDEAAMAADIETYGLMDYYYFEEYMSYEEFAVYPAKYLNVALGKGLMTPEWLEYLIGRYIIEKR